MSSSEKHASKSPVQSMVGAALTWVSWVQIPVPHSYWKRISLPGA